MSDTRVGIVGEPTDSVESAVESAGATPVVGEDVRPVAFTIAVGGAGIRSVLPSIASPVLPVGLDWRGLESLPVDALPSILPTLCAAFGTDSTTESSSLSASQLTVTQPVLRATCGDCLGYALGDVTLIAGEPARISEFTVVAGDGSSGRQITSVRADGIVVATPVGSHGYAHDAGGPLLGLETNVASIVPIGPFSTAPEHWVVDLSAISLTVDRDEPAVELLVDGTLAGTVPATETVTLSAVDTIETIGIQGGLERL
ncbi:NAD(+)/NADH kinase [Halocatena halophila]|uniref:hypothetical protein n=1 Tax=Halocatena halophila TaxID=2814576 RepID=UPI002ED415C7